MPFAFIRARTKLERAIPLLCLPCRRLVDVAGEQDPFAGDRRRSRRRRPFSGEVTLTPPGAAEARDRGRRCGCRRMTSCDLPLFAPST